MENPLSLSLDDEEIAVVEQFREENGIATFEAALRIVIVDFLAERKRAKKICGGCCDGCKDTCEEVMR